jgi:hypothetical protein
MAALKERVVAIRQQNMPGSSLAKACDYTLNQWSRLAVFLQDGRLEADNNWCNAARGTTWWKALFVPRPSEKLALHR